MASGSSSIAGRSGGSLKLSAPGAGHGGTARYVAARIEKLVAVPATARGPPLADLRSCVAPRRRLPASRHPLGAGPSAPEFSSSAPSHRHCPTVTWHFQGSRLATSNARAVRGAVVMVSAPVRMPRYLRPTRRTSLRCLDSRRGCNRVGRERAGRSCLRAGGRRRTAKTAPLPLRSSVTRPSAPPGNRWLRNRSSSEVTDETDFRRWTSFRVGSAARGRRRARQGLSGLLAPDTRIRHPEDG